MHPVDEEQERRFGTGGAATTDSCPQYLAALVSGRRSARRAVPQHCEIADCIIQR